MFDILTDGTVDIIAACLAEANNGLVPYDMIVGGTSSMLNIDKTDVHTHSLTVTSSFHKRLDDRSVSMLNRRFQGRVRGISTVQDIPSVFEPGTQPRYPASVATPALRSLGKCIAYAEANGEDSQPLLHAAKKALGIDGDLMRIVPVTSADRTKPWALDDAPRSRHVNGMYNIMQNVLISLGNYQSNVNTGQRLVDYMRVATLLRSIGALLYGYEEWVEPHVLDRPFTLAYHLNLSEFPKLVSGRFVTPYSLKVLENLTRVLPLGDTTLLGLQEVFRLAVEDPGYMAHRVPITQMDPDIKLATADLLVDLRAKRVYGPLIRGDIRSDISLPTTSLSSFSLLPKPASDRLARTPRNASYRLMVPWLKVVLQRLAWPHQIAHLIDLDKHEDAAELLVEHLDRRIPRLAFKIVSVHTPVGRNVWRALLKWLFLDPGHIPQISIHDPTTAYFASLRCNPAVLLSLYTTCYYKALSTVSFFGREDLLVTSDLNALDSLTKLRQALYKRISRCYARRYASRVTILVQQINALKRQVATTQVRTTRTALQARQKSITDNIVAHQWRQKVYPRLLPIDDRSAAFDPATYLACVQSMLENYTRKRKKSLMATGVQTYLHAASLVGTPLIEQLGRLTMITKLKLTAQFEDVMSRREMTLKDIDDFIHFEQPLPLGHDELWLPDEFEDHEQAPPAPSLFDMYQWGEISDGDEDPTDGITYPDQSYATDPSSEREIPADICAVLSMPMGAESVKPVTTVNWTIELLDAGYGDYWASKVMERYNVERDQAVQGVVYDEMLQYVASIYEIRYKVKDRQLLLDQPDIQ